MSRVETTYGPVEGVTAENGVEGFYGIPFAAPPTGELRFKSPRPPQSWTEVRKADGFGPWSLQPPPGVGSVIGGGGAGQLGGGPTPKHRNPPRPNAGAHKTPG